MVTKVRLLRVQHGSKVKDIALAVGIPIVTYNKFELAQGYLRKSIGNR